MLFGLKMVADLTTTGRFLVTGDLISLDGGIWRAQPALSRLSAALRNERVDEIREVLLASPSFRTFARSVGELEIGQTLERSLFGRGAGTYRALGEVTCICAQVQGEGIYATPATPDAEAFVPVALKRYSELEGGDGLVATGAWLESLIRKDGIHPESGVDWMRPVNVDLSGGPRRALPCKLRNDDHIVYVSAVAREPAQRSCLFTSIVGTI